MLNIDAITLRLDKVEQNVSLLKELAALSFSDFQKNPVNFQAAQHLLQVAIEACLNIGSHIISAIGGRRPKEYKDIFVILGEEKVLTPNFASKLVPMAKFRNMLVHLYFEVGVEEVYRIMQENLGDFNEFSRQICEFIKEYEKVNNVER